MLDDMGDLFADLARSVASPFGPPDGRSLLEAMTVDGTRRALQSFVREAPSRIELPADLLETLDRFAIGMTGFTEAWHPALGALYHVRKNRDPVFLSDAAREMAAWARACPDSWHVGNREPRPAPFRHRTEEDALRALPAINVEHGRALSGGLRLLDAASSSYAAWVRQVVRQVAPLACSGTEVASWSSLHYPGLVSLTLFDSPLDMAETLVHEASHQWYHMLDRCFPMVEPGAVETSCWSPIKRCPRPLPMILLAFHAFGNIALFFHDLRREGILDAAGFRYHMADLRAWLPALADSLDDVKGLTTYGETLWRDLYARVAPTLAEGEVLIA